MKTQHHDVTFESDGSPVQGRIVASEAARRGVLFVHGWDSDQQHCAGTARAMTNPPT